MVIRTCLNLNNIKLSVRENSHFLWPKHSIPLSSNNSLYFQISEDKCLVCIATKCSFACKSRIVEYGSTPIIQLFESCSTPLTNDSYNNKHRNLLLMLFHPLLYRMLGVFKKQHRILHHYTDECHYGDRYSVVSKEYLGRMHDASFKCKFILYVAFYLRVKISIFKSEFQNDNDVAAVECVTAMTQL